MLPCYLWKMKLSLPWQMGLLFGNVVIWVGGGALCLHFLGADGALLVMLAIGMAGTFALFARRWRFKKALAAISDADGRIVRFCGTKEECQAATEIAKSKGWMGENLPVTDSRLLGIRFIPSESASSAQDLLRSLFDAGLVTKLHK